MNKSYTIDEIISGYYENEFAKAADIPMPQLSLRHKIRMNRIFKQYARNKNQALNTISYEKPYRETARRPLSLGKRIIIAALIVILLAFMTGFVITFVSKGFKGVVYNDNTHIFAINAEGCPTQIEKRYVLSVVPEGYELYGSDSDDTWSYTDYINVEANKYLSFEQYVKSEFNPHINTEGNELRETTINGCNAVCVEFKNNQSIGSMVIWEDQDYVLKLSGDFSLEEAMELAEKMQLMDFSS